MTLLALILAGLALAAVTATWIHQERTKHTDTCRCHRKEDP